MKILSPVSYVALARTSKELALLARDISQLKKQQWITVNVADCSWIYAPAINYLRYFTGLLGEPAPLSALRGRTVRLRDRVTSFTLRCHAWSLDVKYLKSECYVAYLSWPNGVTTMYFNRRGYYLPKFQEFHAEKLGYTVHSTPDYLEYDFGKHHVILENGGYRSNATPEDWPTVKKLVQQLKEENHNTQLELIHRLFSE